MQLAICEVLVVLSGVMMDLLCVFAVQCCAMWSLSLYRMRGIDESRIIVCVCVCAGG